MQAEFYSYHGSSFSQDLPDCQGSCRSQLGSYKSADAYRNEMAHAGATATLLLILFLLILLHLFSSSPLPPHFTLSHSPCILLLPFLISSKSFLPACKTGGYIFVLSNDPCTNYYKMIIIVIITFLLHPLSSSTLPCSSSFPFISFSTSFASH